MELKNHSIIITPIKNNPREGWYKADKADKADKDDDTWQNFQTLASEEEEWVW